VTKENRREEKATEIIQREVNCLFSSIQSSEFVPASRVADLVKIAISHLVLSTAVGHIRSTEVFFAVESAGLQHEKEKREKGC